jgi:hypothetical protein
MTEESSTWMASVLELPLHRNDWAVVRPDKQKFNFVHKKPIKFATKRQKVSNRRIFIGINLQNIIMMYCTGNSIKFIIFENVLHIMGIGGRGDRPPGSLNRVKTVKIIPVYY